MKNLMTRKIVFGMLMTLVLVFSVQGIADALRLSKVSEIVQSKRLGASFEIQFDTDLASPVTKSGYKKRSTSDPHYNTNNNADPKTLYYNSAKILSAWTLLEGTGTGSTFGLRWRKVDNVYWYYTVTKVEDDLNDDGDFNDYETSGRDLNGDGDFLDRETSYTYIMYNSQGVVSSDNPPDFLKSASLTSGSKITTVHDNTNVFTEASAIYYNGEGISIDVQKGSADISSSANLTLANGESFSGVVTAVRSETDELTTSTASLLETDLYRPRRLVDGRTRFTFEPGNADADVGTYTITITDVTPTIDFPTGQVPTRQSKIVFTLYVTTEDPIGDTPVSIMTEDNTQYQRVDTAEEIETVSDRFEIENAEEDARVRYKIVLGSGTLYVGTIDREDTTPTQDLSVHKDASVYLNVNGTTNEVSASIAGSDRRTFSATIVYEYSGSGGSTGGTTGGTTGGGTPRTPPPATPSLTFFPSTLSGAPGTTATLTAIVSNQVQGVPVTFTLSSSDGTVLSPISTNSVGQAQTTILLPSSSATVTATASGYSQANASISVTGTAPGTPAPTPASVVSEPSSLEIYDGDDQQGEINQRLDEDLVVQVLDNNNNGVSFELVRFRVVEGNGRVSPSSKRTDSDGMAEVSFTPRRAGPEGIIEIEAYLGDLSPVTFTVNVGEPPDAIKKISGDNQSGRPGARLANPFVVEVVDENGDGVSGATVTFSVTAGGGSVLPTSATTGTNGRAQTVLTLGDEIGDNTVSGRVTGLTGVTFRAGAGAEVHVDASNRAPIYWIDKQNGTLHRLVDDEVENLASNVEGVTSLAVDEANGLIYWGVQVGRSGGRIQRSRLNGRNIQVLKDGLTSIPMGIALDAAGSTIYWTSASGKIRSMATEGSTKVTKILEDLANPTVLAVSNGYLYWAEPLGRVSRVSLTATRKVPVHIATGLGEPLSIAIARGKIYWVERNGGKGGSLQRANLNGTQSEELKAFTGGVPLGISIDSSDNKIYWTKLSKIQRTNLTGRSVTDVVTGLTRPGAIALGVAAEPVVEQTPRTPRTSQTPQTPAPTYSKYDINRDGSVNSVDLDLILADLNNSGNAITNPRTDVDGSGTVDVVDLILVIRVLDDDTAAPAIDVDLTAMDLDFDRVQEQVEMLLASGDTSLVGQRALMYLQHLLASARPDATVLLANYPNPFNPETWIPYHLASSTDVRINIYNAQGILVRALTLGHQSAGYYTSRSRSAYWDGRNALGERVASGIYFYQLQADEISPLRKMVILK